MLQRLPFWILAGSILLAINAGFINSIALLSFANNAVSHVTGSVSMASTALVAADWGMFIYLFYILVSFLFGAILSGMIVGDEALRLGRRYGLALFIEAILLLGAWYGFWQSQEYAEWLASAACGLQNAMIATYSGSVIRTTHLTGIMSDIGSSLGNFLAGRGLARFQLLLQISIFMAFFFGAAVGTLSFGWFSYHAILFKAAWVFILALVYSLYIYRNRINRVTNN